MATEKDRVPAGSLRMEWIQEQVRTGRYLFTMHGDAERRNDGFTVADVEQALLAGRIIEDYAGSLWRTPWEREMQP